MGPWQQDKPMREETNFAVESLIFSEELDHINLGAFDPGNVLYHANYFHIIEKLREKFLLKAGFSYKKVMELGYHLPIIHSELFFKKPLFYEGSYKGSLFLLELGQIKIRFGHQLHNTSTNQLIFAATTTHTCVKSVDGTFKPSKFPDELFTLLKQRLPNV